MQNVPRRPRRRNGGIVGLAETAQDSAEAARIIVAELRKLLDPLGSRVLGRAFGRLERHAADLDGIADRLLAFTEEQNGGNGRP